MARTDASRVLDTFANALLDVLRERRPELSLRLDRLAASARAAAAEPVLDEHLDLACTAAAGRALASRGEISLGESPQPGHGTDRSRMP